MMTHSQIEFVWNRTDDEHEQSSWYTERACCVPLKRFSCSRTPVHWTENRFFRTRLIWEPMIWWYCACVIQRTVIACYDWHSTSEPNFWTTDSVLMLSGARSQEFHSPKHTCCGDVTLKVIWFNALFCMNLTTTWLMGNKQHSEIFRQTFS